MNKNSSDSHLPRVRDYSRENVQEFIQKRMGPQHLPITTVLPMTLIYTAIFITGVVGNLAVCRVIAKNPSMQTTTNYYLFSLALSDLSLLILGLPYEVSVYWHQYPWPLGLASCKCRALVSEMASYTSVLTIVAFTMERYMAVCRPLKSHRKSGLERATIIIAIVWMVSLVAASPFAIFTTINYLEYPENSGKYLQETAFCAMLHSNVPEWLPIYELSFVFSFLLPMMIITVFTTRIGKAIQSREDEFRHGAVHMNPKQIHANRHISRMLFAVVVTFFICWFPFHAQRLFYVYGRDLEIYSVLNEWLINVTGVFYYLSATMNPILYNMMSKNYRKAFRRTLPCGKRNSRKTDIEMNLIDIVPLKKSPIAVEPKIECAIELLPANCESKNFDKESYSDGENMAIEIHRQPLPKTLEKSLSFSYERECQHIKPTGSAFDRGSCASV